MPFAGKVTQLASLLSVRHLGQVHFSSLIRLKSVTWPDNSPTVAADKVPAACPRQGVRVFARELRVAAPSIRGAFACVLLAAAPTTPSCFCRWQRSSLLHCAEGKAPRWPAVPQRCSKASASVVPPRTWTGPLPQTVLRETPDTLARLSRNLPRQGVRVFSRECVAPRENLPDGLPSPHVAARPVRR